ncbi:MAG: tRNA-dihydrouridine synthase, partial [Alphaproteobacteria bacterium]|nr:tRNA-dihydrouridine synthase [Alphaproteobacteria bacterium]
MIVYPAIDLKDGRCVRLVRGEMNSATVFNDDPAAQARSFAAAGAKWIHVVDLDGAFAGKPRNVAAVEAIVKAVPVKVQLGGGIRDAATLEAWLGKGVARVVLGTAAIKNPNLVRAACRR